jgi:hypothetical protein
MGGEEKRDGVPASFWARLLETETWIRRLELQLRAAAERLRNRRGAAEGAPETEPEPDPDSKP